MNLEDTGTDAATDPLWPVGIVARRIQVARAVAFERGIPAYVTARLGTDISEARNPADRLTETLRRAEAYPEAGPRESSFPRLRTSQSSSSSWPGSRGR